MNRFGLTSNLKRLIGSRFIGTRLTADGKEIPKKKTFENRITLINSDSTISITDLKNAESLSLRRDLKLVKIQDIDAKTRRPVYKLMTNAEYHQEELEKRKEKQNSRQNNVSKGEKVISLSTRIEENDLLTAVKKMIKLLQKQYEVRVIVASEGVEQQQQSEKIYSVIEKHIKSIGKVVQKRNKGNSLRFQLLPVKESSTQDFNSADSNSNQSDKKDDKGPL